MTYNKAAKRAVKDVSNYAKVTLGPNHRNAVILVANDHRGYLIHMRKEDLNNTYIPNNEFIDR